MERNNALTEIPERIPDGEYRLFVEDVFVHTDGDESTRTAAVKLLPPRPETASTYSTLLALSEFDDSAAPGAAYSVEVVGDSLDGVVADPEVSIEHLAPTVPESEFVIPIVWTGDWAGEVGFSPHLVRFARNHSLLVTGEPGAGKTEFINLLLPQIRANPDEPVVVFDYKGEYREWAERRGDVRRISTRDSTAFWNVFREARDERELEQIGRALFRDREQRATKPFFPIAARQVLVATMKFLAREGNRTGIQPDNAEVTDFFQRYGPDELYRLVTGRRTGGSDDGDVSGYEDLQGIISHLNPDAPKQSGGVYSTLQSVVRDVFTGDFARRNGRFSVREYMNDPRGRVLLLDYPIREGDRVTAPFRYFLERAIELGLEDDDRNAFFVLDEFARIPHVAKLETLVATGRSRRVQGIFGLQSLSQMSARYGQQATESMLSGMTQEVFLRSGDPATTEYVRSRIGGERNVSYSARSGRGGDRVDTAVSTPAVQQRIQQFAPGEGILVTRGGYVHAQVPMWSQLRDRTRRVIREREPVWS